MREKLCACLAAACWLFAGCAVNQNINFLSPGPASWIVYPSPPRIPPLAGIPMTALFRREFILPSKPATASLSWRCLKAGQLTLNGALASSALWNTATDLDVAAFLHPGTNQIEVRVSCANALPALNLSLETANFRLNSDETWESSLAGATPQPARLASRPVQPAPGNWLYGAENLRDTLQTSYPLLLGFVLLAALAVATCARWGTRLPRKLQIAWPIVLAAAWALLFLHNFPLLPPMSGFDASGHLAYIQFIQEHKSLPSAGRGWEMFQAPLYYLLGAALLGLFHLKALQPQAAPVLCLLNLLLGAAEWALLLAALRLLFPGQRQRQITGLLFAAFLPAWIYLLHYPTNEILGAVTTTAALCLCLRMLREANPPPAWYAALGIALGAALSSKATAAVMFPPIFLALAANARLNRQPLSSFALRAGLCLAVSFLLGGWHYWRLWRAYGNPLIGNWDPAIGGAWWQYPGYRTPSYYFTFGQSLIRPIGSGFHSFWDGLYSTWWGDGSIGGATRLYGRPPWNYNLVTAGFLLALLPTTLVLTGFVRALNEAWRQRRPDWLLLTTSALLLGFAIFAMSVKLPYYSQSRAIYGLPALLPFCAFGALGLEFWAARLRWARPLLFVGLGVWMLTVYTSFWIRPDTVQTRLSRAVGLLSASRADSAPAFEKVLELDPHNPIAIESLAELDKDAGQTPRALARLKTATHTTTNAIICTTIALYLGEQGRSAEALKWAAQACDLAPDYPAAPALLCSLSLQAGQNEQAAQAGRSALRLAPQDYQLHFNTGLALVRLKRFPDAADCFSGALDDSPRAPDAHFWWGITLWNLPGEKPNALDHIAAAVRLSPQNSRWKATLDEMQHELSSP